MDEGSSNSGGGWASAGSRPGGASGVGVASEEDEKERARRRDERLQAERERAAVFGSQLAGFLVSYACVRKQLGRKTSFVNSPPGFLNGPFVAATLNYELATYSYNFTTCIPFTESIVGSVHIP